MIQAKLTQPGRIEFSDVPVPKPGPTQALLKVKRIGICGSDIHAFHGIHRFVTFPIVQGHEGSGEIVETGSEVSGFAAGDRVTVRPQASCGRCIHCLGGNFNLCEEYKVIGVIGGIAGMASEYFQVEASLLHKLPDGMSFDQGAMVEPAAVAVHSIRRGGRIQGAKVLVFGAGPIGNLVAQAAKAFGAQQVMITDINQTRLDLAQKCQIDYCINTSKEDLKKAVCDRFGRDRADIIFDCAAVKATILNSIDLARRGSSILIVGNFNEPVSLELALVQRREISLIGVMNYIGADFDDAIQLIAAGKIRTTEFVSAYFGLKDYLSAYHYIQANTNSVMKVMIKVAD
jgi:L-iditol 2-dehydrogenase